MNISIFVTITLIFLVLKLCHVIAWSWLLVLSPMIAGLAIDGLIIVIALYIKLKK